MQSVKTWPSTLLILIGISLSLPAAHAQQDGPVQFNFPNVDIRSVVEVVQQLTGENFVVGGAVTGKISVVTSDKIPAADVFPLFLSALFLTFTTPR